MKHSFLILFLILASAAFSQYSLEWIARYAGTGSSSDYVNDMSFDNNGNIYLTGQSINKYLTIKYDDNGSQQWANLHPNHFLAMDIPYSLITDDSGNVYITGEAWLNPFNKDFVTVKYNSSGIEQWLRSFDNPLGYTDRAYSIVIYKNRYLYVSGANSYGDSGNCNFKWTVIKYDLNGNQLWYNQFCGYTDYVLGDYAPGASMAIDSSGNTVIAGMNKEKPGGNYELVIVKFDSSGNQMWLKRTTNIISSGLRLTDLLIFMSEFMMEDL